jgi:hypothetical protein
MSDVRWERTGRHGSEDTMRGTTLVAAVCVLLTAIPSAAQETTGSIAGRVVVALHADYRLTTHKNQRVALLADVFNLFDTQKPLDYDPDTQTSFPVLNPDLGQPSRTNLAQLQTPRQVRFGVRYEF